MLSVILRTVAKTVLPSVLKAIAPTATALLKSVVGDAFEAGGKWLNRQVSNLPSPLQSLAKRLLAGLPKLQELAMTGIDKLLSSITGVPTPRQTSDGINVTTPSLPDRAAAMAVETPVTPPVAQSTSQAATSAPSFEGGSAPNPANYDMTTISGQSKFNADMYNYQQKMSTMQNFWQLMSNVLKSQSDTQKGMIANLR